MICGLSVEDESECSGHEGREEIYKLEETSSMCLWLMCRLCGGEGGWLDRLERDCNSSNM